MKALLYLMSYAIILCSCTHDPIYQPYVCDDIYFEDDIRPILMKSCGSNTINCHYSETNYNKKVALYTYYDIANSSNNDLLDFEDPTDCELYDECMDLDCDGYEDYNHSLEDRLAIMTWLENGATSGYCHNICLEEEPTYENSIKKLMYNCIGCHFDGVPSNRIGLESYDEVVYAINNFDLKGRILSDLDDYKMPQDYRLKNCEIELSG